MWVVHKRYFFQPLYLKKYSRRTENENLRKTNRKLEENELKYFKCVWNKSIKFTILNFEHPDLRVFYYRH